MAYLAIAAIMFGINLLPGLRTTDLGRAVDKQFGDVIDHVFGSLWSVALQVVLLPAALRPLASISGAE